MLQPSLKKNDARAKQLIWFFSVTVFSGVALLSNFKLNVHFNFDVHIFAKLNAYLNTIIAILLIGAFIAVKNRKYVLHKKLMLSSLILSIIFLLSYIAHHLFAGETKFGDANADGFLSPAELLKVGNLRTVYLIILFSHILLAAIILPFILFTAYRGLTAEYIIHKKIARYTFPLWLYIAITGPLIYLMISPYYH